MKTPNTTPLRVASLALAILCGSLATGCLTMPEVNSEDNLGRLAIEINPAAVSSSRDLPLKEMTVTLASSMGDTLRDTITAAGSRLSRFPTRLNAPEGFRIVHPVYALDPEKDWSVEVRTRDHRDSIVHLGSARVGTLVAGSLRNVPMRLDARFAAYEAAFALPEDALRRGHRLRRVSVDIDGATACEADADGQAARLVCDYLPAGSQAMMTMKAHVETDSGETLLYKGTAYVDIAPDAPAESLTLASAEPDTGHLGMKVLLGAVGKVTVNVITSGALDL